MPELRGLLKYYDQARRRPRSEGIIRFNAPLHRFRNSGVGMSNVAVQFGGVCSPFVVQLTRFNSILPFAVMGVCLFIGAAMCWVLPETRGKKTAEVMEDVEKEEGRKRGVEDDITVCHPHKDDALSTPGENAWDTKL